MLYLRLLRHLLLPGHQTGPRSLRRMALLVVFVPAFLAVQSIHWVGFLLDEVLFPGYRKVKVKEPLFVVGLPRSGTSFLQRVLADDAERFTTTRLWELLLAPSITERRFWLGLGWLDRALGRPVGRLLEAGESRGFAFMEAIHEVSFDEPEEDYFFLLPVFACFLLVLAFPYHRAVWEVSRFDEMPETTRRRLVRFYHRCVQRHLYVVGPDRRLLSKNPSFTPMVATLAEEFPDGRFLFCLRDPREIVPSLLSSVREGGEVFGYDITAPEIRDRFVEMLRWYSRHGHDVLGSLPEDRCRFVPMPALGPDLRETVEAVYAAFGWPVGPEFGRRLEARAEKARAYRSRHRYSVEEFGLREEEILAWFPRLSETLGIDAPEDERA